ncbi:restriction endonuclease [Corynebacterium renale]|uniref:Restriction system protein n=1 Tax=Corynebacterium renale TaxID=1724 RepID=A0A2A9DT39_9CORY|nr:restriction endonuclease [Corynebacterium renale]PFG29079.1 restriction system protein [Corynebacterium renale]SQI25243.1 putative restriction system protein [Corynebacterium renale]
MTDNTPTFDEFRPVVLEVLASGETLQLKEIRQRVAAHMSLSPEILAEKLPSGHSRSASRISWACSALFTAGLLDRPARGKYRITRDGLTVQKRHLKTYSEKDMYEWPQWRAYQEEIKQRKTGSDDNKEIETDSSDENEHDPIELMTTAEQNFNAQTETALRKRLQESSPEFFEKAVLDLLWAMGYGGTNGKKHHVGKSGDGGIDGVIQQDALGLTNVYIQAKRYSDANKVQAPEARNFIGSLASKSSNLGVFITTSTFSSGAKEAAASYYHGKVVLIDGIQLTSLMLHYGVAVQKAKQFTLYEVDEDYFDDETFV